MKKMYRFALAAVAASALSLSSFQVSAETAKTTKYPVILAHGMVGWDSLAGINYFGDDSGTFVGDSCQFLEINGCNDWINESQTPKTEAFQVTSLNSSEVRGNELYDHVRNFMATTGASMVNLVGHSQGGFDIRKTAHRLKAHYGTVKVGAMIEIPAAALTVPMFLRHFDFLSIGTNDLIQYTLAIDRADEAVSHLYDPVHPAVLQLIASTIAQCQAQGKGVSVCGEMAGDVGMTRLLLGMGLRSFSMHPSQILSVKQQILRSDTAKLTAWAHSVLAADDPAALMTD